MYEVTITVVVGADRRVTIDLPPKTPLGPADVLIVPRLSRVDAPNETPREVARAKLLAVGALSHAVHAPAGTVALSESDLERLGRLAPGARPSEELIDEDRGPY